MASKNPSKNRRARGQLLLTVTAREGYPGKVLIEATPRLPTADRVAIVEKLRECGGRGELQLLPCDVENVIACALLEPGDLEPCVNWLAEHAGEWIGFDVTGVGPCPDGADFGFALWGIAKEFKPQEVATRAPGKEWKRRVVRTRVAFDRLMVKCDEDAVEVFVRDAEVV
jgi:hypothetical protein